MFNFNSGERNTLKRTAEGDGDVDDDMPLPDSVINDEIDYVHNHPHGILFFVDLPQDISKN